MKNSASHKRRLFLTKNFILLLVMLVVIIMAISAWFTVYQSVEANTINVKAISSEIDIAPCIKTYDANYEVLTDGPGEFGRKIEFSDFTLYKDCTGDGESLIVPEFNVTKDYNSVRREGGKEVNENLGAATAISNEYSRIQKLKHPELDELEYQYIEFEFYVRSKNAEFKLHNDSKVVSFTESDGGSLSTTLSNGDAKKSAYGNFNVDGLVGAIRVALIGQPCSSVTQYWEPGLVTSGVKAPNTNRGNPVKQLLWVPRPDVRLDIPETDNDITNWTLATGVVSGETYSNKYYKTIDNNNAVELVDPDPDLGGKTRVSSGVTDGIKSLGADVNVTDFTGSGTTPTLVPLVVSSTNTSVVEDYYVTKYTMRVWIEGTDSEARRAMDGGTFDIELNFM